MIICVTLQVLLYNKKELLDMCISSLDYTIP